MEVPLANPIALPGICDSHEGRESKGWRGQEQSLNVRVVGAQCAGQRGEELIESDRPAISAVSIDRSERRARRLTTIAVSVSAMTCVR